MNNTMIKMIKSKFIYLMTSFAILVAFSLINTTLVSAASYKFPWGSATDWQYLQGWHCNAYNCALDVGVGTADSYKNALLSTDGTISNICSDGYSHNVTITNNDGTMGFMHILNGSLESNMYIGSIVKQGQFIGKLKTGSWEPDPSPGCGYAYQTTSTGHIHWTFRTDLSYTIDGWTISYPSNTFTDGTNYKYVSDTLHSTNTMTVRDQTLTSNKTYETQGIIMLSGDGNGLNLNPASGNLISIISH